MHSFVRKRFGKWRREPSRAASFSLDAMKAFALDVFSAPVFILRNGEIIFANQACCKAFGLASQQEIIGHHITQRLSAVQPDGLQMRQSLDRFNEAFHQCGFARRMWSLKRLDGSANVIRATVVKIPHTHDRYSVSIFEDMEAFAAEHALQQSAVRALAENGTVKAVADRVSVTALRLTNGARSLTQSSERATAMLKEGLAAAEKTASSTSSISASSADLSACTDLLMSRMTQSGLQVRDAASEAKTFCATIASLSIAASRIGDITKLVGAFANQTQLLALNATIEAARAGEAGKGFAVVAAEVKTLASQSEKATQDVRDQTNAIRKIIEQTARSMEEMSNTFANLHQNVDGLVRDLDNQRAATHDINRSVQTSAQAAQDLNVIVDRLFLIVSENDLMSADLLENSTKLQAEAGSLQDEVRDFSAVAI